MGPEIVVVGASTGGLKGLQLLLSEISPEFPLPIVIVQHRTNESGLGLCEFLAGHSRLPLSEPDDKEPIVNGRAYLAPYNYHLLIVDKSFALSTDAPVAFARPSIDLLFESAADEYRERAIGVILTGANSDGARGLAKIKSHGGVAVVQDPNTAAFPDMPRAAINGTDVNWVVPLKEMAPLLQQLVNCKAK